MTGQIGQYFFSFGIVSAAAFLLSMFISFTLTPALCGHWLRPTDAKHKTSKSQGFYAVIDRTYGKMLGWSLRYRFVIILVAGAVVMSAYFLFGRVGKELVPDDDQAEFGVSVRLPQGTNFRRTDEFIRPIEESLRNMQEVKTVFTNVNAGSANFTLSLTPLEERDISQQELMRQARASLRKFQGARISVSGGTSLAGSSSGGRGGGGGGGGANRVQLLIQGPDIDQLQAYVVELLAKVRTIPGIVDADTNFEATAPELRVRVDRARAADLGVSIDSLASNLRLLVGGDEVSKYRDGDDQFSVKLRLDEQFRNDPATMGDLLIPGAGNRPLKVSDVAKLTLEPGPAGIDRYNRQRQISLFGSLDGRCPSPVPRWSSENT